MPSIQKNSSLHCFRDWRKNVSGQLILTKRQNKQRRDRREDREKQRTKRRMRTKRRNRKMMRMFWTKENLFVNVWRKIKRKSMNKFQHCEYCLFELLCFFLFRFA
ncbi:hypothetical protein PMAYCL1PPCAC_28263, partial [Pristionchus mayeri]